MLLTLGSGKQMNGSTTLKNNFCWVLTILALKIHSKNFLLRNKSVMRVILIKLLIFTFLVCPLTRILGRLRSMQSLRNKIF